MIDCAFLADDRIWGCCFIPFPSVSFLVCFYPRFTLSANPATSKKLQDCQTLCWGSRKTLGTYLCIEELVGYRVNSVKPPIASRGLLSELKLSTNISSFV
jgi:hypothetical protein